MRVKFNPPREYYIEKFKHDMRVYNEFTTYCNEATQRISLRAKKDKSRDLGEK